DQVGCHGIAGAMTVECYKCGARGPRCSGFGEAIFAWNRRAPAPASEPAVGWDAVMYQFRTRPHWQLDAWSRWTECTKEQHDEKLAKPLVGDWHYEVRALHLAAPAAQEVPAVPEAAPVVASYGPVHVVADLVRNLLTLDQ